MKKLYVCEECGQTHYSDMKPKKCLNCSRKLLKKNIKILEVYQL